VLTPTEGTNIGRVRYEDFDSAEIVKGYSSYFLMSKRPAFAHEHEVRATISLPEPGKGVEVSCDLNRLISRVYVAPGAPAIFTEVVSQLCSGIIHGQQFSVVKSSLNDSPDYDIMMPA